MPLLRHPPRCPIHGCELVLSHHGKKSNVGHACLQVQGAPLRYCPQCYADGRDTSVEVAAERSNQFLRQLARLLDRFDFGDDLQRPSIRVDFNPRRASGVSPDLPTSSPVHGRITDFAAESPPVAAALGTNAAAPNSVEPENAAAALHPRSPRHTFDQLILDATTLRQIREAINVLAAQELLFSTWNLASVARGGRRVALNFFGPPGTGKTLAADAIADFLGKEILTISYAELESKYVGETPKNIRAAFQRASDTAALLFFDEADSVLGKRLTSINQAADNGINVARSTTLIELDNFDGVVIFASNLVENYDAAFLRRMLAHIEFHLPAAAQRTAIWQAHLPPQLPLAADVDCDALAASCDGAAGGDIQNAVLLAASYAALRPTAEQVVSQSDFARAIQFVLRGKERIIGR
ncbi:ATP-binding protein [Thiospirillum jenense]|uniref:ATP-binding protein n=1 Tax=Thiospirillum jenense TaxID=1653858 RepID=A0A839HGV0_9GAMM|nr:ATP-binding protein [Thiospirillum jenense]MBB1127190.1 ATP-binding protein [Thiospirillum jenense]